MSLDVPLPQSRDPDTVFDCIAIGFGPSNIALAIALEMQGASGNVLFLERETAPDWHGQLLLPHASIWHPPLHDLVTPLDPSSRYGFLQYLQSEHRLANFLLDPCMPVPRVEYARYVRWVARQFDRCVRYASDVTAITPRTTSGDIKFDVTLVSGERYLACNIVLGTGVAMPMPDALQDLSWPRCVNATSYLTAAARWRIEGAPTRICLIGQARIAPDILCDLAQRFPDSRVQWHCPGDIPRLPQLTQRLNEWAVMGDERVTCHPWSALKSATQRHGKDIVLALSGPNAHIREIPCDAVISASDDDGAFGTASGKVKHPHISALDDDQRVHVFKHGTAQRSNTGDSFSDIPARAAQIAKTLLQTMAPTSQVS